ncbi:MAG: dephospho-CoA kinase [Cyanobacteria bacterium P01_A01_bin.135]
MSPYIIGLTGGIGMGKSTASHYLSQAHSLPVLDADLLAREAVQPGSPALEAIAARYSDRYGNGVLNPDGSLDRTALARIIFQDEGDRRWVEEQIHPYVRDRMQQETQMLAGTVVWSVPLLFEAGIATAVDQVWVVYCTAQQQRERLLARGLSAEQIEARIVAQWPIEQKLAQAHVTLDNTSTLRTLHQQIDDAVEALQHRPQR